MYQKSKNDLNVDYFLLNQKWDKTAIFRFPCNRQKSYVFGKKFIFSFAVMSCGGKGYTLYTSKLRVVDVDGCWWCKSCYTCWKNHKYMPNSRICKVSPDLHFYRKSTASCSPASAFRYQAHSGTTGNGLDRHCPAMLICVDSHSDVTKRSWFLTQKWHAWFGIWELSKWQS